MHRASTRLTLRVIRSPLQDSHEAAPTERVRALQDARLLVALETDGTRQLLVQPATQLPRVRLPGYLAGRHGGAHGVGA